MTEFRYVAVSPERTGDYSRLSKASYLHEFLVNHQTDASGMVNYGRPVGYAWIRAHWDGNPDERPSPRTLKRHMAVLKKTGKVHVRVLGFGVGMIIRLLGSVKWSRPAEPPAEQIPMFVKLPREIRTGKSCGKSEFSTVSHYHMGPNMALVGGQKWPRKEVKKYIKEKDTGASRHYSIGIVEKTQEEIDARRRLLLDQAEQVIQKFKSAG